MTRREAIKILAVSLPAFSLSRSLAKQLDARGNSFAPFTASFDSLQKYRCPDWFRDAKFGIWAHWGAQSAPEAGDWYARNLYVEGSRQNRFHVEHYGHPSKFGYKDIIPLWTGENFDPEHLVSLYKKAGAKYFMSMGIHCDNVALWNSKLTRWNSANFGPRKDIVALFRAAARRQGLKFGVSEHSWISQKWFSVARGSDKSGALAGVPYDGADPGLADLYCESEKIYRDLPWNEDDISEKWKRYWLARATELIDHAEPDIVYCDGPIPFGELGLQLVAHLYNKNAQAVFTSKRESDSQNGECVFDKERGVVDGIWPRPWQTCTCVGDWHYRRDFDYKTPKRIIDMLVDIVSRNGNLLLNFPLRGDGTLDNHELKILAEITGWMRVNGEAIYETRPWKIFGDGPTVQAADPKVKYNETNRKDLTAGDVRFTTKGKTLFAFFMGWPENQQVVIAPLATKRSYVAGNIQNVRLIGHRGKLQWKHDESGLAVRLPAAPPCAHAFALEIKGLTA